MEVGFRQQRDDCDHGVAASQLCTGRSMRSQIELGDPDRHSEYFFIPHFLKQIPGDHAEVMHNCWLLLLLTAAAGCRCGGGDGRGCAHLM